jgi:thymidylate synthase
MTLTSTNLSSLYRHALARVLRLGEETSPRGQKTREIRGMSLVLENPHCNLIVSPERKLNYAFGAAEFLWILSGLNQLDVIQAFNSNLGGFSDDGLRLRGAYGPKVVEQLGYVEDTLSRDPDSRQALISIWRERPGPTKDVPCTVALQYFVRDNKLEALTYMRSNDLWLGFPYDVYVFTQLQRYLAYRLNVNVGRYRHVVGSMHLYEQHFERAADVTRELTAWHPESTPFDEDYNVRVMAAFVATASGHPISGDHGDAWNDLLNLVAAKRLKDRDYPEPFDGLYAGNISP